MNDIVNVFQNFAYPTAISIILIVSIAYIFKRELKQNEESDKAINQANQNFISYLQAQNERLTNIIQNNTIAYNKLVDVLDDIQNYLNKQRKC